NTVNVRMEEHYASWLETMFAQFGHKWLCLHRGPVWQYEVEKAVEQPVQENDISCSYPQSDEVMENISDSSVQDPAGNKVTSDSLEIETGLLCPAEMERFHSISPTSVRSTTTRRNPDMYNPLKSKVNIASLGARQIQKRVKSSGFSRTVDVQMEALNKAKEGKPQGRWWIKADGCDVRKGLRESVRVTWSGDEDLGDGSLQRLFNIYKLRRSSVMVIGNPKRSGVVCSDMKKVLADLKNDLDFLTIGAKASNKAYVKAVDENKSSEQTMMELSWNAVGFEELLKKCLGLQKDLNSFFGGDDNVDLLLVKGELLQYLNGLFSKKACCCNPLVGLHDI
ncbi:Hypothetical predicted protein, partial [Paramuricea clavata]